MTAFRHGAGRQSEVQGGSFGFGVQRAGQVIPEGLELLVITNSVRASKPCTIAGRLGRFTIVLGVTAAVDFVFTAIGAGMPLYALGGFRSR